jgi:ribosomal protein S21
MTVRNNELDQACRELKARLDGLKARQEYVESHKAVVYAKGKTLLVKRGNK